LHYGGTWLLWILNGLFDNNGGSLQRAFVIAYKTLGIAPLFDFILTWAVFFGYGTEE
jgi:hypothetical protein